jgi:hypothetical protein
MNSIKKLKDLLLQESEEERAIREFMGYENPSKLVKFLYLRHKLFQKIGLERLMNAFAEKHCRIDEIANLENPKKLERIIRRSKMEILISYPIFFSTILFLGSLPEDWKSIALLPIILGVYLNWRGEVEYLSSGKRLEELKGIKRW